MSEFQLAMTAPGDFARKLRAIASLRRRASYWRLKTREKPRGTGPNRKTRPLWLGDCTGEAEYVVRLVQGSPGEGRDFDVSFVTLRQSRTVRKSNRCRPLRDVTPSTPDTTARYPC